MYQLDLPEPGPVAAPPFRDVAGARAWLASQPQTQPMQMQVVLFKAIAAIDASDIVPASRVEILDVLRGAVALAQSAAETRYTRKPLPLPEAEAEVFKLSRRLWRILATAYLRTVPMLPPTAAVVPLHRGAMALRLEQYAHFAAGHEVPVKLLRLLYAVLSIAESLGIQRAAISDPHYKQLGDSNIAGHVAWAFLLQFVDPLKLSLAQLTVANRSFSRWREIAGFQAVPENDSRARALPLADLIGEESLAEDGPRWLDVRPVARKIRKRIESLEGGESPEELKLGRELSAAACIRLLHQLNDALGPNVKPEGGEMGTVELVFGGENIYALLTGRELNPAILDASSRGISHQRMAVFGFDNQATLPAAAVRAAVARESWQAAGGHVLRAPDGGARLLSPCLVAAPREGGKAELGILAGLYQTQEGSLKGVLQWYAQPVGAAWLKAPGGTGGKESRLPVFVLGSADDSSLVAPATAGLREGSSVTLEGGKMPQVLLGEVLERGSDFIRYAVKQK